MCCRKPTKLARKPSHSPHNAWEHRQNYFSNPTTNDITSNAVGIRNRPRGILRRVSRTHICDKCNRRHFICARGQPRTSSSSHKNHTTETTICVSGSLTTSMKTLRCTKCLRYNGEICTADHYLTPNTHDHVMLQCHCQQLVLYKQTRRHHEFRWSCSEAGACGMWHKMCTQTYTSFKLGNSLLLKQNMACDCSVQISPMVFWIRFAVNRLPTWPC